MDALSDAEAVEIAAQVLDALAHAHRAGIVHRDVKPANILLEDRDELAVRLLDFGLAQFDGADTLTATATSPERSRTSRPSGSRGADATAESDVWSVGVLLWETLAGRHPFWGMPLQEVARRSRPALLRSPGSGATSRAGCSPPSTARSRPIPPRGRAHRCSPPSSGRPRAGRRARAAPRASPSEVRPGAGAAPCAPRNPGRARRADGPARRDPAPVLAACARRSRSWS